MSVFDFLQLLGGIILSSGSIPQINQILSTKSVEDLNIKTYALYFLGVLFMEIYAINLVINGSGTMFLVTNTLALVLNAMVAILVCKYKKKQTINKEV